MGRIDAECVICFEALHIAPVGILCREGRRACCHFFHKHCAEACPTEGGCPLCRAPFTGVAPVPPLALPKAWFDAMDVDRNGRLDQLEVLHALAATLPLDSKALEAALPALLPDRCGLGARALTFSDLFGPGGLLPTLRRSPKLRRAAPPHVSRAAASPRCPDLGRNRRAWFLFWDADGSGSLEREEIVRGLVKSFKSDLPTELFNKRVRMRYVVEEIWPMIDTDANGCITLDEFCRAGGLADLILERFAAKCPPQGPRGGPQGHQSPRRAGGPPGARSDPLGGGGAGAPGARGRPLRERARGCCRAPDPAHDWSDPRVTDLPDGGETDRPSLAFRPALGFRRSLRRRVKPSARMPAAVAGPSSPQTSPPDAGARGEDDGAAPWSVVGRLRSKDIGIASPWITEPVRRPTPRRSHFCVQPCSDRGCTS